MAALFALMGVVIVSFVIVTVAATMLELTGMDRENARFQALSAFSGTGFTTRVSELMVRHPVRRRITTVLMVLGNAGTAGIVATLIGSFSAGTGLQILVNLALLVVFAAGTAYLVQAFGQRFGDRVRRYLTPRMTGEAVPTEELMLYRRGFGIARVQVLAGSRLLGVPLRDAGLREAGLQVLAIEQGIEVHPVPSPDWEFAAGQNVIVYGRLEAVQARFAPPEES